MRYLIAMIIAGSLTALLFLGHLWVNSRLPPALQNRRGLAANANMKVPEDVHLLLDIDDFLYEYRLIIAGLFFVTGLGIAMVWPTRSVPEAKR